MRKAKEGNASIVQMVVKLEEATQITGALREALDSGEHKEVAMKEVRVTEELCTRNRWGEDNKIRTLHFVTPEKLLAPRPGGGQQSSWTVHEVG